MRRIFSHSVTENISKCVRITIRAGMRRPKISKNINRLRRPNFFMMKVKRIDPPRLKIAFIDTAK